MTFICPRCGRRDETCMRFGIAECNRCLDERALEAAERRMLDSAAAGDEAGVQDAAEAVKRFRERTMR